jgi:hypothetical protein
VANGKEDRLQWLYEEMKKDIEKRKVARANDKAAPDSEERNN